MGHEGERGEGEGAREAKPHEGGAATGHEGERGEGHEGVCAARGTGYGSVLCVPDTIVLMVLARQWASACIP